MPLPLKVPSHRLQRLWSSCLQFLVQGIGLEVPEENSDSTQEVGAANQTQATAKSHRHKAWSRLPNLCMKRIREVVLGLSGVGGMGTGSERHRLAGVTLVFFSYREGKGVEERRNHSTRVAFTSFSSGFSICHSLCTWIKLRIQITLSLLLLTFIMAAEFSAQGINNACFQSREARTQANTAAMKEQQLCFRSMLYFQATSRYLCSHPCQSGQENPEAGV